MSALAATKGTFADFRLVKTRKVCQIFLEIPIEAADAALAALGGLPRSDQETWVAIARLDLSKAPDESTAKEHRIFCDLPGPTQAAIKCKDPLFRKFMNASDVDECALLVRKYCLVTSRSDIIIGSSHGDLWIDLLREFERSK